MAVAPHLRIGELSRRVGVSAELLRAWERRYGLLHPDRSSGGFRLYGPDDERRVLLMREHLDQGVSAAEAARLAIAGERPPSAAAEPEAVPVPSPARARARLAAARQVRRRRGARGHRRPAGELHAGRRARPGRAPVPSD